MTEFVVLDAVSVATIARAARDLTSCDGDLGMLPDAVAGALRALGDAELCTAARDALGAYAVELDEIAEAAVLLDQHEHEIEHQLRWWGERTTVLESQLTGHPADDVDVVRELALFRGRISGAETMRRHYVQQRSGLLQRHRAADTDCARRLGEC
ncbi:MAG TPA: hypothetical protein VNR36_04510 [Pseudolysinimonas sp.]|nr:hypothetical protein [Pseudolysinimonas sp.]